MKIVVASGKGGTGKTTVSLGLSWVLTNHFNLDVSLLDADVEAPNDHLYFPEQEYSTSVVTVDRPLWDASRCIGCGLCVDACKFNAIAKVKNKILVFDELCHSCGACIKLCPQSAFKSSNPSIGEIKSCSISPLLHFSQGELRIGESLAPKIIKQLKASAPNASVTIIDASPGTTCPVVEAMRGCDYCLLVTEPTPFGLNDLKLASSLAEELKLPTAIIINRSYGDDSIIEDFARASRIPIIGKIPFSRDYARESAQGNLLAATFPEVANILISAYSKIAPQASIPRVIDSFMPAESDISLLTEMNVPFQGKELVIISGKGGTGKTTVSLALSYLLPNVTMGDCDVDAANFNLVGETRLLERNNFIGSNKYTIDHTRCTQCQQCVGICAFGAIEEFSYPVVDQHRCEGCGLCAALCPVKAIDAHEVVSGEWFISKNDRGSLSHAKLHVGEENSGKLVKKVRDNAEQLACINSSEAILVDGPPGTGCPVISALSGIDRALIVTEPTLSGIHDLKRAMNLCRHFSIPFWVVINKWDLSPEMSTEVESATNACGGEIIGRIPFDVIVHRALVAGKSVLHVGESSVKNELEKIAAKILEER